MSYDKEVALAVERSLLKYAYAFECGCLAEGPLYVKEPPTTLLLLPFLFLLCCDVHQEEKHPYRGKWIQHDGTPVSKNRLIEIEQQERVRSGYGRLTHPEILEKNINFLPTGTKVYGC
jgi:hypothetical protein